MSDLNTLSPVQLTRLLIAGKILEKGSDTLAVKETGIPIHVMQSAKQVEDKTGSKIAAAAKEDIEREAMQLYGGANSQVTSRSSAVIAKQRRAAWTMLAELGGGDVERARYEIAQRFNLVIEGSPANIPKVRPNSDAPSLFGTLKGAVNTARAAVTVVMEEVRDRQSGAGDASLQNSIEDAKRKHEEAKAQLQARMAEHAKENLRAAADPSAVNSGTTVEQPTPDVFQGGDTAAAKTPAKVDPKFDIAKLNQSRFKNHEEFYSLVQGDKVFLLGPPPGADLSLENHPWNVMKKAGFEANKEYEIVIRQGGKRCININNQAFVMDAEIPYFALTEKVKRPDPEVIWKKIETFLSDTPDLLRGLEEFRDTIITNQERAAAVPPLPLLDVNMNFMIQGYPGTGKTVFFRMLGELLFAWGLIDKPTVMEIPASNVTQGFLGQTQVELRKLLDEGLGGLIFIDEIHQWASQKGDMYGKQAIETGIPYLENHRGAQCNCHKADAAGLFNAYSRTAFGVAGYPGENKMGAFVKYDPGMDGRIPNQYFFDHFSDKKLVRIMRESLDKMEFKGNVEEVCKAFEKICSEKERVESFENGRFVRNYFEAAYKRYSARIATAKRAGKPLTREQLASFDIEDFTGVTLRQVTKIFEEQEKQRQKEKMAQLQALVEQAAQVSSLGEAAVVNTTIDVAEELLLTAKKTGNDASVDAQGGVSNPPAKTEEKEVKIAMAGAE